MSEIIVHPFPPVFDSESRVLVLGSFPSVKSREEGFYYGHERNRFWRVLESVFECSHLDTVERKKTFLLEHHIAIWDSIASCRIVGSSDSSIADVVANDVKGLVDNSRVNVILANGNKAWEVYMKYIFESVGIPAIKLPSTSPANASWSLERLVEEWKTYLIKASY